MKLRVRCAIGYFHRVLLMISARIVFIESRG